MNDSSAIAAARAATDRFSRVELTALGAGEFGAKLAVRVFVEWATVAVNRGANPASAAVDQIAGVIEALTALCNDTRIHPLDIVDFAHQAIFSDVVAVTTRKRANEHGPDYAEAMVGGIGNLASDAAVTILRGFHRSRRMLTTSRFAVMQQMARTLRMYEGMLFRGFYQKSGLRAWEPPSATRLKEAGNTQRRLLSGFQDRVPGVVGVEITSIRYRIPVEFDADGEPTRWRSVEHRTGGTQAREIAKRFGSSEDEYLAYFNYLLDLTPAGRLWLAYDLATKRIFLATDRPPSRSVFVVAKPSESDAAVHGISPLNAPLTGFTI